MAHLDVILVVVQGHENCGAVSAALACGANGHNLNVLVPHLTPAGKDKAAQLSNAVQKNAKLTAAVLRERSEIPDRKPRDNVPPYCNPTSGKVNLH